MAVESSFSDFECRFLGRNAMEQKRVPRFRVPALPPKKFLHFSSLQRRIYCRSRKPSLPTSRRLSERSHQLSLLGRVHFPLCFVPPYAQKFGIAKVREVTIVVAAGFVRAVLDQCLKECTQCRLKLRILCGLCIICIAVHLPVDRKRPLDPLRGDRARCFSCLCQ
eukprot:1237144-Rhodomonas_salina.3